MVTDLMTIPCTILRAGSTADRYGNVNIDWSHTTSIQTKCFIHVAMRKQHDNNINRSGASEIGTVFLPAGTDIRPNDKLQILGETYMTLGLPAEIVRGADGTVNHIELEVVRSVG